MSRKIVFIGAGSTMFARLLICDIYAHPALRDATIVLEDVDEERLHVTYRLAQKIVETNQLPGRIECTTSQREALKGADFVISMIAVGGLEAWDIDKELKMDRPTKAELLGFFNADIINESTLRNELREHGYKDEYVNWYVQANIKKKGGK